MLANRLSEDPGVRVLLLEAGGSDANLFVRMPSALYIPMNSPRLNWGYVSEPEPGLAGRRLACPRGRVLGGSSSINGMVYVRGHACDFERWQAMGADGWDYTGVLPYFRRAERAQGERREAGYRGEDGPLTTTLGRRRSPLYDAFLDACAEAGYARPADLNGYQQEGFGDLPMTVDRGVRCSAARAYLAPARRRPNLEIRKHAMVERVLFDADRARGVQVSGEALHAQREVILAAGAINSPQLLMLSGVGPGDELRRQHIDVRVDLPGVGANLMDHLEVYVQQACTRPVSLHSAVSLAGKARVGARWLLRRDGLGATNHFEVGGFVRSAPGIAWPDIQFHFLPVAMSYDGRWRARGHGYQVHVGPMLSPSRGRLTLRSADPTAAPLIRFGYMSTDADREVFRAAVRHAREIFAQPALDAYRGDELAPGPDVTSDTDLDHWIATNAQSAYHPCGTARMGGDAHAVVDPDCRVHGVRGLRVVDASVFPYITNGNLNAPTIMLAERAADLIRGHTPLRDARPWHVDPDWCRRQRPGTPARPSPHNATLA